MADTPNPFLDLLNGKTDEATKPAVVAPEAAPAAAPAANPFAAILSGEPAAAVPEPTGQKPGYAPIKHLTPFGSYTHPEGPPESIPIGEVPGRAVAHLIPNVVDIVSKLAAGAKAGV